MRDFNCSGFRVRGVRLSGLGLGHEVDRFGVWGLGFEVLRFNLRSQGLRSRNLGFEVLYRRDPKNLKPKP